MSPISYVRNMTLFLGNASQFTPVKHGCRTKERTLTNLVNTMWDTLYLSKKTTFTEVQTPCMRDNTRLMLPVFLLTYKDYKDVNPRPDGLAIAYIASDMARSYNGQLV